ncbi:MAG TPA: fumarylacetoacetate hydrolase family protein [bacterium]|nr:fumarylacetoacetate hydrolase family protein [bacterium]
MKVVTFATETGRERLGVQEEAGIVDLAAASLARGTGDAAHVADVLAFLQAGGVGRELARTLTEWASARQDAAFVFAPDQVRLVAPVPRPPKVLCMAGNYAEHWREGGLQAPVKPQSAPEIFIKPVTTIAGPGESIRLPGPICTAVDYEGELAAVIGRKAKNVPAERALTYVAGYANFNDVSGRKLTIDIPREVTPRTRYFDWSNGKWFDTFGPLGPYLVVDEIADPQALPIQTRVNGEVRQNATTADMIFAVAELVAWISRFVTLQPGDVIATGTPSGVGSSTQTFLRPGDVVEVEVTGLGVLRNMVAAG